MRRALGILGGIGIKLIALWMLVLSGATLLKLGRVIPLLQGLPKWTYLPVFVGLVISAVLFTFPLVFGLILRRSWARKLWIYSLVVSLFFPLFHYWFYGPFSPRCSFAGIAGHFVWTFVFLSICFYRPFIRYMNREGGRIWLRIGLIMLSLMVLGVFGVGIAGAVYLKKHPVELVAIPDVSGEKALPKGWDEVEILGYVVPIPMGGSNSVSIAEGVTVEAYALREKGQIQASVLMSDEEALYQRLPAEYGLNSLEDDFKHRYVVNNFVSAQHRWIRSFAPVSHAGFRAGPLFDLFVEVWENQRGRYVEVTLESVDGSHRHLIMSAQEGWSIEQWMDLLARIRPVEEEM